MDYLRASLVIAPQLLAGCLIYLLLLKRTDVAAVELLSIGFAIGITTSTICDQIFVNLDWPKIGWLLPLFISIFVGFYVLRAKKIVLAKVAWRGEFKKHFSQSLLSQQPRLAPSGFGCFRLESSWLLLQR